MKTVFQYVSRHYESLDAVFYFELSDICGSSNLRCRAANNEHNSTYLGTYPSIRWQWHWVLTKNSKIRTLFVGNICPIIATANF